jgi:hypothetical protein
MPCKSTLIVESDSKGKLVQWTLRCEGDCPDHKKCKRHRVLQQSGADGDRYMFVCACNADGDDNVPHTHCHMVVFEWVPRQGKSKFTAKCLGHCAEAPAFRCRPMVVKEYRIAATGNDDDFELDGVELNTVRHYVCACPDDFI